MESPESPMRLSQREWPSISEWNWFSQLSKSRVDSLSKLKEMARSDLIEMARSELREMARSELKKTASELNEDSGIWPDGHVVNDVLTLLKVCEVDFLVSGKGDKVPISALEGKDVGFYFYTPSSNDFVLRELVYLYEELRKQGKNFELVFICVHRTYLKPVRMITWPFIIDREEMVSKKFQNYFNGRTWLALPFSQSYSQRKSSRMLYRWSKVLTRFYGPPELVIIRPSENIAHACAMDIFREFGIEAYPFSKSKVTEIQVERLKSWKLDSLLCSGLKIPASYLFGKKILLFLYPSPLSAALEERVGRWYCEMKQKDEAFEMICGCYDLNGDEIRPRDKRFPWLELPYDETRIYEMNGILKYMGMKEKMNKCIPMMVAFGRDGRFITMTSLDKKLLYDDDKDDDKCLTQDFFDDTHLFRQVSYYIAIGNRWCSPHEDGYVHYHEVGCVEVSDDFDKEINTED